MIDRDLMKSLSEGYEETNRTYSEYFKKGEKAAMSNQDLAANKVESLAKGARKRSFKLQKMLGQLDTLMKKIESDPEHRLSAADGTHFRRMAEDLNSIIIYLGTMAGIQSAMGPRHKKKTRKRRVTANY